VGGGIKNQEVTQCKHNGTQKKKKVNPSEGKPGRKIGDAPAKEKTMKKKENWVLKGERKRLTRVSSKEQKQTLNTPENTGAEKERKSNPQKGPETQKEKMKARGILGGESGGAGKETDRK